MLFLAFLAGTAHADKKYRVQRGDTLSSIAAGQGVEIALLKEINHLKTSRIQVNQFLTIPDAIEEPKTASTSPSEIRESYVVKKGDTLSAISLKTGVSITKLSEINKLSSERLKIGQKLALRSAVDKIASLPLPAETLTVDAEKALLKKQSNETQPAALAQFPDNAKLLSQWTSPKEPKLLVNVALAFLDAPYRLGGSSVRGIDCSGFVKKIYSLFDIDLPRTAAEQAKVGVEVARDSLMEGDLIFFRTKKSRIGHVGIYIGNDKFVHAASGTRKVRVDSLDASYYKTRYKRAVRLKALETPPHDSAFMMMKDDALPGV